MFSEELLLVSLIEKKVAQLEAELKICVIYHIISKCLVALRENYDLKNTEGCSQLR